MSEELRRLRAQQEAQAAQLHRLQMQQQAQQARQYAQQDDEYEEVEEPQYQQVQPDEALVNHIAQRAAQQAAYNVQQNLQAEQSVQSSIKARMERLVDEYPEIRSEDSPLTAKARDAYARIAAENGTLDEATKYELAVREAASRMGIRPVNAPAEDIAMDFVLGASGGNRTKPRASTKSRLNESILKNAMAMGINVDPNSAEGKKNLAELNEYSARFNADQDEQAYKYR